jgi:NADPH-dependent glutamate synthase beta subunit-like oxidoreductase
MRDALAESLGVSLFLSRSSEPTSSNKTGSWSFSRPRRSERAAPCSAACPCAEDIPRIEMLASRGRSGEALAAILEENPLPGTCGRVCFHPCEAACNRAGFDEPVSINALERAISDSGPDGAELAAMKALRAAARRPRNDAPGRAAERRRVAIVGSGPAGLSAAWFLALLGYDCEIREAASAAGGLLRWGIPEYRLPTAVLEREIDRIRSLGVRILCGRRTDEVELAELAREADAVVLATGKGRALGLGVTGEGLARDALVLLADARRGAAPRLDGRRVAVVGGGNTAVDAARSLLRLGAEPVIVYRRRREDMPALPEEVEAALAEGVRLEELAAPAAIEGAEGRLSLRCSRMRALEKGSDGRASISAVPGGDFRLEVAAVYAAVGAESAEAWMRIRGDPALRLPRCAIDISALEGRPLAWIGDLAGGRESVSDAVASGKEAAIALDALFSGGPEKVRTEVEGARAAEGGSASMEIRLGGPRAARARTIVGPEALNLDYATSSRRAATRALDPATSARSFEEVELGLDRAEAAAQAERCLGCGICNDCDNCRTFCPEAAVGVGLPGSGDARAPNPDYCKGCGICVVECPRGALTMEETSS